MAITIRLPHDLEKTLKETATREDRSASAVIRRALVEYCDKSKDNNKNGEK